MSEKKRNHGDAILERQVVDGDLLPEHDAGATTSVVVPAYNERGNIRPLVDELREVVMTELVATDYTPIEILLVDDGSTDGTRQIIEEVSADDPLVKGVFLRRNFGQTHALTAGIDHASGDVIVTMDADLQNNPADIPTLLSTLDEGYDCVSGWRRDRNDPVTKTLPSAIQTWILQRTGANIHDFGCTLKAYRAEALRDIDLYGEGHRYIPAKLSKRGYSITEEVVDHRERVHGETKYGVGRLVRGFVDLLFHVFWNRFSTRPSHFLGGAGVLLSAVGFVIGAHAVFMKYAFGEALTPHLPRLVLTVALVLFGIQLLMFGFLAEMIIKIYYSDSKTYRVERVVGDSGE